MNKVLAWLIKPWILFGLIALVVLGITLQNYLMEVKLNGSPLQELTYYTNYLIFKNSFLHLIHHQDLYLLFPAEHADLYKYSPTFALLMAPFAVLPDFGGLLVWNLLNALVLFAAIWKLPAGEGKRRLLAIGFVLIEAVTALTNSQSNCLLCGLLIFAFLFLEKGNYNLAALMLVLSVYIKLFGLVAFVLFLFYPRKGKALFWSLSWFLILGLLPLLVVSPSGLIELYKSWSAMLANDHSISYGFSAMAWLHTWFRLDVQKNLVAIAGLVLFCVPLIRYKQYASRTYRMLFLSSVLLWVVIFNHKAESPSFVIAVSGVAIWYFCQEFNRINLLLLLLTFVFTVLSPTDIFPVSVRDNVFIPYVVKVVPCILVWIKITIDLMRTNEKKEGNPISPEGNPVQVRSSS